ncbi:MAG: peptidoglycan bridge formation glycyltransferase FemA/FemB family protein [Chloroflexota bacterium]
MTKLVPAGSDDRRTWDTFVDSRPEADVLQAWAWGEAMAGAGQPAIRLMAVDAGGVVRGLVQALIRPTTYRRSVVYAPHGPIWDRGAGDGPAVLALLLDGLGAAARAHRGIVVKVDPAADRVGSDDSAAVESALVAVGLRRARHDLQARTTLIVDLAGDDEAIRDRWTPEARNLARRSAREGVMVQIARRADRAVIAAAGALLVETGTRRGFRTHDVGFLERLAAELEESGGLYVGIGRLGDRLLGVMVVARTGDRAVYLYGGSLRDDANRHANPGYGVMAAMISALAADGVRWFDLWGVHDAQDTDADPSWQGFSAFKRRFGGRELRHPGTFDLVVSAPWYRLRDIRERIRDRR